MLIMQVEQRICIANICEKVNVKKRMFNGEKKFDNVTCIWRNYI